MPSDPQQTIYYKRARFTTRLPINRLYSQSHYWLLEERPGTFRIGLTKFATRMLGDFVELNFDVATGEPVETGRILSLIRSDEPVDDIDRPVRSPSALSSGSCCVTSKRSRDPSTKGNRSHHSAADFRLGATDGILFILRTIRVARLSERVR